MNAFIEVFLSIHLLLCLSSFFISVKSFARRPSLGLQLARWVFLSCLISPIAVRFIQTPEKPMFANVLSLEVLHEPLFYKIHKTPQDAEIKISAQETRSFQIDFVKILYTIFFLILFYQLHKFFKDYNKLHRILISSYTWKRRGRVSVQISDTCLIPFSVFMWGRAYILVPLAFLNSTKHLRIALAHEGQHHRQGDCLWVYLFELVSRVFFGNLGLKRWRRIFHELQELACDEHVVGHHISAYDYGHCLYELAQTVLQSSDSEHRNFACTVGMTWDFGMTKESLITRRICMLSQYRSFTSRRSFLGKLLTMSAILTPLCTAYIARAALHSSDVKVSEDSFDAKMQVIAQKEIDKAIIHYRAKSGAIAIGDPRTGNIIAFAEAGHPDASWRTQVFTPASTLKPFIAAAAIDKGLSSENAVYDCRDPYVVDGKAFYNADSHEGSVSLHEAMTRSVNVCMIKVAQDLGVSQFRNSLAQFGFDTSNHWSSDRSDALQVALASLGMDNVVPTTIETLVKAYSILANKGRSEERSVVSEASAQAVTRMLVDVVENGTAKRAAVQGIAVAGKTGTIGTTTRLASFAAYAPAENPSFVAYIVIENGYVPGTNEYGYGGAVAAPVFQNLAKKILARD